ncbi:alpha/beta hydrolase, partial [Pseudomonas aeruginosa]|nr:alpha/beta hydrolase [Pseudomonas aeruginosa]
SLAAAPREEDLSVGVYVDDVVAWSERLARDPRFSRLILVGHSEGALIASLAAPRTPAEELIAIAGSGQPIDRVLREQL